MTKAGLGGGEDFGDAAGKTAGRRFGSAMKKAAKVALVGAAAAGAAAFAFGKDAVEEAREAQKIGALTESTIKATGGAAKVTAKRVGDLSEALSEQAGIDDEIIQRGANMLLTFKNIRNEQGKNNKIFDEATRLTTDMAAAMAGGSGDVDLKSSSILVGKALNDPVKGLSALSRVGVSFTKEQQEQIKTLVASGETMKAQKVILGELESQFGGAAAAQATAGEKLSVAWGNFKEEIGTRLLPVLDRFQGFLMDKGIPAARRFSDWVIEDGVPALKGFADEMRPVADELIPAAATALQKIRDFASDAAPYAKDIVGAFNDLPDWVKTVLIAGVGGGLAAKKLGVTKLVTGGSGGKGGLLGLVTKAKPLPVFVVNGGAGVAGVPGKGGKVPPVVPVGGKPSWFSRWFGVNPMNMARSPLTKFLPVLPALGSYVEDPEKNAKRLSPEQNKQLVDWQMSQLSRSEKAHRRWMESLNASFETLPKTVQTDIVLNGAPETRRDVLDLVAKYDLARKDVRTLFGTYGIPQSKRDVEEFGRAISRIPRFVPVRVETQFGTSGIRTGAGGVHLEGTGGATPKVAVTYNGPVTYTDDEQGRRRAQREANRSQLDGARRLP